MSMKASLIWIKRLNLKVCEFVGLAMRAIIWSSHLCLAVKMERTPMMTKVWLALEVAFNLCKRALTQLEASRRRISSSGNASLKWFRKSKRKRSREPGILSARWHRRQNKLWTCIVDAKWSCNRKMPAPLPEPKPMSQRSSKKDEKRSLRNTDLS